MMSCELSFGSVSVSCIATGGLEPDGIGVSSSGTGTYVSRVPSRICLAMADRQFETAPSDMTQSWLV